MKENPSSFIPDLLKKSAPGFLTKGCVSGASMGRKAGLFKWYLAERFSPFSSCMSYSRVTHRKSSVGSGLISLLLPFSKLSSYLPEGRDALSLPLPQRGEGNRLNEQGKKCLKFRMFWFCLFFFPSRHFVPRFSFHKLPVSTPRHYINC